MYYPEARSYWDASVNQSPAEFLRECTMPELSRGFAAIAADYVRAYDAELRAAGHNDDTLHGLQIAIATVLGRESWLGTVADDDDAEEFYNPFDDGDRSISY